MAVQSFFPSLSFGCEKPRVLTSASGAMTICHNVNPRNVSPCFGTSFPFEAPFPGKGPLPVEVPLPVEGPAPVWPVVVVLPPDLDESLSCVRVLKKTSL